MTAWSIPDERDYRADPSVQVTPVRLFTKGDPKVIKQDELSDKPVKVKVTGRFSVAHEGKRYAKDDTVTVPELVADEWLRAGWVERVTTTAAKP